MLVPCQGFEPSTERSPVKRLDGSPPRGLRRGKYCGLRWAAVDLYRGLLFVKRQRTTAGVEAL